MATYLARLLNINGLSQSQLARATGVYQPQISLLCNGHKKPSWNEAKKLSDFFDLPINVKKASSYHLSENARMIRRWEWFSHL
jgi:transcriptional regulator with XRE-family HTH domain